MPKKIYDIIHGYITLSDLALEIIDTPEFQRLRNIKQLAVCHYIFPSANHTRFEHSLGVYHLAGRFLSNLDGIDCSDYTIELIKIAGLCHDLGHGPYSHMFDKLMDKNKCSENYHHEQRSVGILKLIVNKWNINLSDDDINFIEKCIIPDESENDYKYTLICNKKTGLDLDKIDYIIRDSFYLGMPFSLDHLRFLDNAKIVDNTIHYDWKTVANIYDIYYHRYRLHRDVYGHKAVKSIQYMLIHILKEIDIDYNEIVENLPEFCKLTDSIIDKANNHQLMINIKCRKLYKCIDVVEDNEINREKYKEYILDCYKYELEIPDIPFYNKSNIKYPTINFSDKFIRVYDLKLN